MRTTLKRGVGRTAEVNGNGRAVFPPGVLSPVKRYVQPPPPRRGMLALLGRVLAATIAAISLVAGSAAGGAYLYFHKSVEALRPRTAAVKVAQKRLDAAPPGAAAIALVIGYDARRGIEAGGPSRSDTIMLLRADPKTKTISMLSFPRDLRVALYCPGHASSVGKINQAYANCGPKGTVETVKHLTGLPVNYLITVDFHGFKAIVNKLHGIWIDVDRRYYNPHGTGYASIDLQPGYQRLDGQQALDYVRFRHTDSDLYRLARQQAFIKAFKQRIAQSIKPTNLILKLPGLIAAITKNVEVGVGGGGKLSDKTVRSYALFAYDLPPGHFFQAKIDNVGDSGPSDLIASQTDIESAVRRFVNPDLQAGTKATAVALGRKLKSRAPKPGLTTVTVLNGNGVQGSATAAAYSLAEHSYQIRDPLGPGLANAPTQDYFHTKVYFDPRRAGAREAATAMQTFFEPADIQAVPRPIRRLSRSMLTVVVGQTFHGQIAAPQPDDTPKRQPPAVRFDASAQEDALRQVKQKGVPFPLMVPAAVERNSRLDYEEPVRRYRIAKGHWGVRLVFQTGAPGDYWGVEETDWQDAPVLGDRSFRHVLGRKPKRIYDFYYSGSNLHMIVLRAHGATYWVVNTLRDSLSNETMITIAKSLRPLRPA